MIPKGLHKDYLMLREFAEEHEIRPDWHEPDEQGITAEVVGDHLDNAFGNSGTSGELVVDLYVEGKLKCSINLATLLALATR